MNFYRDISLAAFSFFLFANCGEELGAPPVWPDSDSAIFLERDAAAPPMVDALDASTMVPDDGVQESTDAGDMLSEDAFTPQDEDAEVPTPVIPDEPIPEDPLAWVPACDAPPCPIVIEDFPYAHRGDTRTGTELFDAYSCQSETSEAGPEELYVFRLTEPGIVIVGLTEPSAGDVDVHLLTDRSASSCIARSDKGVSRHLMPGIYYISMDTYRSSSNAGTYSIQVTFLPDAGKCGLKVFDMDRVGDNGEKLPMPATGKVVKEAHLVTVSDQTANGSTQWWPSSSTEYLAQHKVRTAQQTGIDYARTESWAPAGEGGCEYGQGSTGRAVPDEAEPWYVCMYWKGEHKPAKGTRYLVINPVTGKAIVAAAGYETGPGDLSNIGGAVEEIHHLMGTNHRGILTFGELIDQTLPYGEIDCW